MLNDTAWREGCFLCAPSQPTGPSAADELRLAYASDELVAFVEVDLPGVLVAPRGHVEGLGKLPGFAGAFLGALRRAAAVVQSAYGAEGAMVEPTTNLSGAVGHVCYRVVATLPGGAGAPVTPAPDPAAVAAHLAEALEDRFVPH